MTNFDSDLISFGAVQMLPAHAHSASSLSGTVEMQAPLPQHPAPPEQGLHPPDNHLVETIGSPPPILSLPGGIGSGSIEGLLALPTLIVILLLCAVVWRIAAVGRRVLPG